MSKAAELAALIGSQTALSNRNLVINGAAMVSQRGDSTGIHDTGYYAVDRFQMVYSGEDELRNSITQASDGPDGFSNSLKIETTTAESAVASDERVYVVTRLEGQDLQQLGYGTSAAKSITVSFYVKSSVTGTYSFIIYQEDGNDTIGSTYTINSADTWERKTLTFAGNTAAAIADDNTNGLIFYWCLMAGSDYTSASNTSWGEWSTAKFFFGHAQNGVTTTANATWQLTGVQIELGEQATPFEHRSFADELRRCQRYYIRWQSTAAKNWPRFFQPAYVDNGYVSGTFAFPVQMRDHPSMAFTGTWTYQNSDGAGTGAINQNGVNIYVQAVGANAICGYSAEGGSLDLDAEL